MQSPVEPVGFALLGSLRVTRAGGEVHLGARQQRLVLALLLARAGALVTMDELVGLLWEQEAPASAANVIHRQIGVLRRLLEPELPTRSVGRFLTRQLAGYQLRVDEDSFDLLRFRRLAGQARSRLRERAADEALGLSLEALRLWRGRCAAGLEPASQTHPAFLAIEAEHATAVREAADAADGCGRLSTVLAPLRQTAGQHPLDESLQSRLLLALAADGRQAEAVDAFHEVRRRLAGELGIDPGAELREAYDRVLHQRAGGVPLKERPRPAQLPPDLPFFSGRAAQLAEAHAIVRRSAAGVLAIDGMPGIGKTTLAVRIAHDLAPSYPDGQLYVDLGGFGGRGAAMDPSEALRGFLGALGVPQDSIPAEPHAQAGMFRSTVAGRRVLIVLDNCRDTEQIRHLLPGTPGCLVIVTSRSRLTGLLTGVGAHLMPVGLPSVDEARAALGRLLGAGRVAASGAAVDGIIESCGRLPLALAVVCARAASLPDTPLDRIADQLLTARGSLDGFDGDAPDTDLRAVFSWSYDALSAPAARLFRLMPCHPGVELSVPAAAALAGAPVRDCRALIAELSRAHLVSEPSPGRYRTHDLLRAYATELSEELDPAADRADADQRCLRFYRATAYAAHERLLRTTRHEPLIGPGPGDTPLTFADRHEAMGWFEAERPVLMALVDQAGGQGRHATAWQLALGMQHYFEYSGRSLDWAATAQSALNAAVRGDDLVGQARMHRSLSGAYYFQGEFEQAVFHLDRSRELLGYLGLGGELARAGINLSMILRGRGRHDEAIAVLAGPAAGEQLPDAMVERSANLVALGRGAEAVALARQAMCHYERDEDCMGMGEAWEVIGRAHAARSEHQAAARAWQAAAGCYRQASAAPQTAEALTALGDALTAIGDRDGAAQAWGEALSLIGYAQDATARALRRRLAD